MTTTPTNANPIHIHAANILRRKHSDYAMRPLAEIVLAVAATAMLSPHAANANQLARDTYRSENGHEAGHSRERCGMVDGEGATIDIADGRDAIEEIEERETLLATAEKIRAALGRDIADGLSEGMPLRDIAEILGTSAATLCRRIAEVREQFTTASNS